MPSVFRICNEHYLSFLGNSNVYSLDQPDMFRILTNLVLAPLAACYKRRAVVDCGVALLRFLGNSCRVYDKSYSLEEVSFPK